MRLSWQLPVIIGTVGVLMFVIARPSCGCGSPDAELKQNLHNIQLTIERYRYDKGSYPATIEDAIKAGYIDALPGNRYNRDDLEAREMRVVQPTDTAGYAGNFSYEHIVRDGEPGYRLTLYGKDRRRWARKNDPASKHVLLVLDSGLADQKIGERAK